MKPAGKKPLFTIFIFCFSLAAATLCTHSTAVASDELVLGIHPYLPALELEERFSPLAEYLSAELGTRVNIKISPSYEEHVHRAAMGETDIAYLGPVPLVRAHKINPELFLLARLEVNGTPLFHGKIVTRKDSGIDSLQQLQGKRFAFGNKSSTMSHLVPRYELMEHGVFKQLASFTHLKGHKSVAIAVMLGNYDAGAVKEEIYNLYKNRGMKLIHNTRPISEHVFVASNHLPAAQQIAIRKLLLSIMQADKGPGILHSIKPSVTDLVPVSISDYDNLKALLGELDGI